MKVQKLLIILLIVIFHSCKEGKTIEPIKPTETVLIGEVIGRPDSKMLWMTKSYEDFRTDSVIKIPIVDCKFSYSFKTDAIESYVLAFEEEAERGAYRAITFFSEKDTIKLALNNNEKFDDNIVVGGEINEEHTNFSKIMRENFYSRYDSIREKYKAHDYKDFQSEAYKIVMAQLRLAKTQEEKVPLYKKRNKLQEDGLDKSELGKIKSIEEKAIHIDMVNYKYNYISKHPTLVSFDLLLMDMIGFDYMDIPLDKILEAYNTLKPKHSKHPYSTLSENLIFGITSLKEGGEYVNFTAPDPNGKQFELKSILEDNEIVLLDLWATWCGPCIAKTRLAKPVYEKYKDKGFTILGVAGEHDDLKSYHKFMAKEQWEWQQLIELDKANRIWEKYSIMNSGGSMFLIDKTGGILAINPTAEELEAILEDKLVSNTLKL
jgi:thiol-disulfide isomerase/thioredoxin